MSRRGKMAAAGEDVEVEPIGDAPAASSFVVDAPDLTEAARAMVQSWLKCWSLQASNPTAMLDVIRRGSRAAFDWLILNNANASGIAVRRDWLRPDFRTPPEEDEKAAVAALCASVAAAARARGMDARPAQAEPPRPTRRQLEILLATWRRDATKDNGGAIRIAMLERQIAAINEPPEPETKGDDAPWIPSALAA